MREEFLERSEELREGLRTLAMRRMLAEQVTRVNSGTERAEEPCAGQAREGVNLHPLPPSATAQK
jgi:hypothetical protein